MEGKTLIMLNTKEYYVDALHIPLIGDEAKKRIAKTYVDRADEVKYIQEHDQRAIQKMIATQFAYLSGRIFFEFTDDDPYTYTKIEELFPDFKRGVIKVNTSGNDSKFWGKVYNLMFRGIHDYIHIVNKLEFNYDQEIKAYEQQLQFTKLFIHDVPNMDFQKYYEVLRSEIVYQAAVKETFDQFHIDQKIILSQL